MNECGNAHCMQWEKYKDTQSKCVLKHEASWKRISRKTRFENSFPINYAAKLRQQIIDKWKDG